MDLSTTKSLYETLPFPQRNPDEEANRLITPPHDFFGRINHHCFQGKENFSDGFRALVAGGGTGDAVIYLAQQLAERGNGKVTYLDQSTNSMKVAQARADRRGLNNIEWVNGSLLDLSPADFGEFDYINCVGVIHHLHNPIEGLQALSSVLKETGVLTLMVYGKYGRQDISDVRELFRHYLPVSNEGSILNDTKAILSALAPQNSYMRGRDRESTLSSLFDDSPNMADLFLNPVEAVYAADEFAALVEDEGGLVLNRFTSHDGDPAIMSYQYNPALFIADTKIRENLAKLPIREQWKIAEIMDGNMHLHCAYVGKRQASTASFLDNKLIPFFPTDHEMLFVKMLIKSEQGSINVRLSNGSDLPVHASQVTRRFLDAMDGDKSIEDILREIVPKQEDNAALLQELTFLSNIDWLFLRASNVERFQYRGGHKPITPVGEQSMHIKYETPTYATHSNL